MWWVYIVLCADNTLYTGVTTDVRRRLREHNNTPRGAKYTRARRPVVLAYKKEYSSRTAAQSAEYSLKKQTRAQKLEIIKKYSQTGSSR